MLTILYMLLIYCEIVVFLIICCSIYTYIKRFFKFVDEVPMEQQRHLPVSEGGRGHFLMRRRFQEYKDAFDYAHFVITRVRINRAIEYRYLQTYKNRMREQNMRYRLRTVTYKIKNSVIEEEKRDIENALAAAAINESIVSTDNESQVDENKDQSKDVKEIKQRFY